MRKCGGRVLVVDEWVGEEGGAALVQGRWFVQGCRLELSCGGGDVFLRAGQAEYLSGA